MASVVSDPNGFRRIQWVGANGKRQQIRLGQLDKRTAERVKHRVESLVGVAFIAVGAVVHACLRPAEAGRKAGSPS